MMRITVTALAAAMLASPGVASAAEPPCLTPAEFTSLSTYALPSVIRGTAQRCAAVLPGNAYLRQGGERLATRYTANKNQSWPGAKAAFLKLGTGMNPQAADLFKSMSDETLKPMVDSLVTGMVGQQLPTDRCSAIDRLLRLLAPLPAAHTAELIGLAAGLGSKTGKARIGQFSICNA